MRYRCVGLLTVSLAFLCSFSLIPAVWAQTPLGINPSFANTTTLLDWAMTSSGFTPTLNGETGASGNAADPNDLTSPTDNAFLNGGTNCSTCSVTVTYTDTTGTDTIPPYIQIDIQTGSSSYAPCIQVTDTSSDSFSNCGAGLSDIVRTCSPPTLSKTTSNTSTWNTVFIDLTGATGLTGAVSTVSVILPTGYTYNFSSNHVYFDNLLGTNIPPGNCGSPTPSATPTGTATPTITPTATPSPTNPPTATPTETWTITPTATSTPTPSISPTPTPSATSTPTPTYTETDTPTPTPQLTATPTPTPSPTGTFTPTATSSPSPTETKTPTSTSTSTTTPTTTPVPSSTSTSTPTPTPSTTPSPTQTVTSTPTDTPSATLTPTSTMTPSPTPTPTITQTTTPTPTRTPTETVTITPTRTDTPTPTITNTPGPTATFTETPCPVDVYPNPMDFKASHNIAACPGQSCIVFSCVPLGSTLRIYTVALELVKGFSPSDIVPNTNVVGTITWDGTNGDLNPVTSGFYIYVIEGPFGRTFGKFAISRSK